jgi:hypothetical protein
MSVTEARRRFVAARDSGRRFWLWPDLAIKDWKDALATIADATRLVLASKPAQLDGDLPAIGVAGYTSGMGPLLGWWVEHGQLQCPQPVATLFLRHLAHNRDRMTVLVAAAREVAAALAARSIEATVLKGMGTAFTAFPDPGTRPMSDIDLLVAPHEEGEAGEVLRSLGFVAGLRNTTSAPQQNWQRRDVAAEPKTLNYLHRDDPWSIDLQTSISRRLGLGRDFADLAAIDIGERVAWSLSGDAVILPQPLQFLQLAVHAGCSLESLSLLRQTELVLVARREMGDNPVAWQQFVDLAHAAGALGACYPALWFAKSIAPDAIPQEVIARALAAAPRGVVSFVAAHEAHDIQRVERTSVSEKLMWAEDWRSIVRELTASVIPRGYRTLPQMIDLYRRRASLVWRWTVSR